MINRISVVLVVGFFTFSGCSSDKGLCDCLEKGNELNQLSNELLFSEEVTNEQEEQLQQLRNEVEIKCEQFKEMNPDELRKLRLSCPDALKEEGAQ